MKDKKTWRRWYWLCECGNAGDAGDAKWVEVGPPTVMSGSRKGPPARLLMLCPRCNRKVDIPSRILGTGVYVERDDWEALPKRVKIKALGEKL